MTARRVSAVPSRAPSAARGGVPVFITPVSRMGHCHHVSYSGTLYPTVSLVWSWSPAVTTSETESASEEFLANSRAGAGFEAVLANAALGGFGGRLPPAALRPPPRPQ